MQRAVSSEQASAGGLVSGQNLCASFVFFAPLWWVWRYTTTKTQSSQSGHKGSRYKVDKETAGDCA